MGNEIKNIKKVASSNRINNRKREKKSVDITNVVEDILQDVKKDVKTSIFKDLDGAFLLVNVGEEDRPASEKDIKDVADTLTSLFEENNINCLAYVTHHAVKIHIIR